MILRVEKGGDQHEEQEEQEEHDIELKLLLPVLTLLDVNLSLWGSAHETVCEGMKAMESWQR